MDHRFTFFVLITALIGFFIEELSKAAKQYWKNQFLRHSGLMMFIGIMGFAYQSSIKQLLTLFLKFTSISSSFIASQLIFFPKKVLLSLAVMQSMMSIVILGCFLLIYYIAKRKLYVFWSHVLWALWLSIGAMYISVVDVNTLFQF